MATSETGVHQHNASSQLGVVPNPDPALDVAREHHHAHLHHDARAERGHDPADEIAYSKGTTAEPSVIPDQDPLDHALHRRHHPDRKSGMDVEKNGELDIEDAERGSFSPVGQEQDPQSHFFARFYAKYRIFFHLAIFCLFTG